MSKPRKKSRAHSKPSVKVKDLSPNKNPKGGDKVVVHDLSITHYVDRASPILMDSTTKTPPK
jgi:type VI protein secretion system component Hcp